MHRANRHWQTQRHMKEQSGRLAPLGQSLSGCVELGKRSAQAKNE